jgi:hypothetical protein
LSFRLESAPPDRFKSTATKLPVTGPVEGRVYSAMAERAFDQLSENLAALLLAQGEREGAKAGVP